ncbi:MAG TPA: DNA repair exonuclease [Desulfotomaculum sp.]|nr:DNA repair exonuclease [Desulfotomaculum sp.]
MILRFVHAADIHLDSPLRGLERYEGAPVEELRAATRGAFENLVELCIAEEVDFLLIAGDVFDGDWKDYNTGLFFAHQMSRLRVAGIRVFLIRGNHDAESQITKRLRLPDNVREFPTSRPETIRIDDLKVAIHGQGFPKAAVTEDLSQSYPEPLAGYFNIGLLHTCADGREGHERYAPCNIQALVAKGYDYWALGHVHRREVLREHPYILFPGNIQGRHIRETGEKGATLVTVALEDGKIRSEHRGLDVVRWSLCSVDVSGADSPEEVFERVKVAIEEEFSHTTGQLLVLRLSLRGTSRLHAGFFRNEEWWINEFRAMATDVAPGKIWVEKVLFRTKGVYAREPTSARGDPLAEVVRYIEQCREDESLWEGVRSTLSHLARVLPPELRRAEEVLDFQDPTFRRQVLDNAEQLLLSRLLEGEGGLNEDL